MSCEATFEHLPYGLGSVRRESIPVDGEPVRTLHSRLHGGAGKGGATSEALEQNASETPNICLWAGMLP